LTRKFKQKGQETASQPNCLYSKLVVTEKITAEQVVYLHHLLK